MELTDPQAIRALAHPLRLDLVELLGQGPMTAAECARALGSTQANCSFHLRQLAKYGFVAPAPEGTDRRERRWQLLDYEQNWSSAEPELTMALEQVFIRRESGRLIDWSVRAAAEPEEWRGSGALGGATVPLTRDELRDVLKRYHEFVEHVTTTYRHRIGDRSTWPDGSRPVRLLFAATPLVDPLAGASEREAAGAEPASSELTETSDLTETAWAPVKRRARKR
jgi:DNA-binding transcriptional ArsR family regulator